MDPYYTSPATQRRRAMLLHSRNIGGLVLWMITRVLYILLKCNNPQLSDDSFDHSFIIFLLFFRLLLLHHFFTFFFKTPSSYSSSLRLFILLGWILHGAQNLPRCTVLVPHQQYGSKATRMLLPADDISFFPLHQ